MGQDQDNKNNKDSAEQSSIDFWKQVIDLLDKTQQPLNEQTRTVLKQLSVKINETLNESSLGETRLNDLGLPMHPLEIEVADMVEQAKQGRVVFPAYNRAEDETPLKYLEKHYGKYLKAFNGDDDYLYQHQLQAIDPKFRNNLRTWLERNGKNIKDYVPSKSKLIDKEVELLKAGKTDLKKKASKLISLNKSR